MLKTKFIALTLLLFSFNNLKASILNKTDPPNIIIFLVDDMGLMDTSVSFITDKKNNQVKYPLNDFYRTPNMENLASQGIMFTNFYAHSVCSPTRASIMSGQNSARHGTTNWINAESNNRTKFGPENWNWKGLNSNSITLPRILQQAGYKTIHIGKAHFGPIGTDGENPLNLGFDVAIAGNSIGHPGSYYAKDAFGLLNGKAHRAVPGLEKYHGEDIFLTEALTLEAKATISQTKKEGKPFFLYMSHYAVHAPFQSDPRFVNHYKDSGKSLNAQAYASLIEGIDKSLGDIIKHIKDLGLGENTLILFLGDNGSDAPLPIADYYSSSAPLKGKKGNHWEGGMRVPFIASWITPNAKNTNQKQTPIKSNALQTQLGTVIDLFPTLCEVANVDLPKNHILDGFKLQNQFKGKTSKSRNEDFLNHFPHGNHRSNYFSSLVHDNWKIIYHYPVENEACYELFDLKKDPFETNDLANTNPKKLKVMIDVLYNDLKSKQALFPEKDKQSLELILPK